MHTRKSHWVTVSNSCIADGVCVYDSLLTTTLEERLKFDVCSFLKPSCDILEFNIMNVDGQRNFSDCGWYALAYATELAAGGDPVICLWDSEKMRSHLMVCLENKRMERFPTIGSRSIRFGTRIRKSVTERIYCVCRFPNDTNKEMIQCQCCKKWFHTSCVSLPAYTDIKQLNWECSDCTDLKLGCFDGQFVNVINTCK